MITKSFRIDIVSPNSAESFDVEWVDIDGRGSSFLVGPNHAPVVSILAKGGYIRYKKHDTHFVHEVLVSSSGIFKLENDRAVVLLDG